MLKTDPNIEEPGQGHNSLSAKDLQKYIERVEACIEQRKDINADIKQILEEADHNGYDKKTIKDVVKIRAMDPDDRKEREELRDAYLSALGLL